MAKKKLYVVVHGRRPGLYEKWSGPGGAAEQVEGMPDALFRGFHSREEALAWLRELGTDTLSRLAPDLLEDVQPELAQRPANDPHRLLESGAVLIFTDGGSIGNPGPGGYGVVLRFQDHRRELSGGFRITTNNRMELLACLEGLKAIRRSAPVVIFSDSRYVVRHLEEGHVRRWRANDWRKEDGNAVENADLWAPLLSLVENWNVRFDWTRGHSGTPDNERCHQLASAAARRQDLPADEGYEGRVTGSGAPAQSGGR